MNIPMYNIYIGNHSLPRKNNNSVGITDQIDWLINYFQGYLTFKTSIQLDINSHNIIIENFDDYDVKEITLFAKNNGKFSILLTEHLEINSDGNLIINNILYDKYNPYMPNAYNRFINLCKLSYYSTLFLSVANMPDISVYKKIFSNINFYQFNKFNSIKFSSIIKNSIDNIFFKYDLCFFGYINDYRLNIINKLKKFGLKIFYDSNLSKEVRDEIIFNSRYNLHIPVDFYWTQESDMRIYSAARISVFTISILPFDTFKEREFFLHEDLYKFVIRLSLNQIISFFNNSNIYKNDYTYEHEIDNIKIQEFINETTFVAI